MIGLEFELTELGPETAEQLREIDRGDVPEAFVGSCETMRAHIEYGAEHGCVGHSYGVRQNGKLVGFILLGEAIPWETDPPEMRARPFYRLMHFVLDRRVRGQGLGGAVLEETIRAVRRDFGDRPIAVGCHRDNHAAERFYARHGFRKTPYMESEDWYWIRGIP